MFNFFTRLLVVVFICGAAFPCIGQDENDSEPIELEVLKASIGVWDVEFEVWPSGPDAPSYKFTGVETNRRFGDHWIASDLDSDFGGQTSTVHSIIGYDLDKKKLVGTVIDEGPYAAKMTAEYDAESKVVSWLLKVKDANGGLIVQRSVITQKSDGERTLALSMKTGDEEEFKKVMNARFVKRK